MHFLLRRWLDGILQLNFPTALSRVTKFGTHWIGNWASPTDGLHAVEKVKESLRFTVTTHALASSHTKIT